MRHLLCVKCGEAADRASARSGRGGRGRRALIRPNRQGGDDIRQKGSGSVRQSHGADQHHPHHDEALTQSRGERSWGLVVQVRRS
eukprot:362387-Chlamydomonas_euryale.AAC.9